MFGKYSVRAVLNRAVSSRVNAQMEWRMRELQISIEKGLAHDASEMARVSEILEAMQRAVTEMSIGVADRLTTLESAALAKADD